MVQHRPAGDCGEERAVPPGPSSHGTRCDLEVGTELALGTVDDRRMVWATTDYERAVLWGNKRNIKAGHTVHVFEVELDDPEVDVNVRLGPGEPVTSVMARERRVVRVRWPRRAEAASMPVRRGPRDRPASRVRGRCRHSCSNALHAL